VSYLIGVDVGATTTTLAVGNDRGEVLQVASQFPTRSEQGPREVTQTIVEQAVATIHSLGGSIDDVAAVGLATPGPATVDGVLLKSPNLDPTKWDKFPIRAELERAFQDRRPGLGVRYLGDGQAAALGEFAIRGRSMKWEQAAAPTLSDETLPGEPNTMPKQHKAQRPTKRTTADERPPSERDCGIYEQHILRGETQQQVAAAHALSQQRVAQIAARVEARLAGHPEHPLAQSLRLRCARRWETLWDDLEKLARFMTGTPIRSVVFIEAEALMRLVNESIGKRREFRLADVDRLPFGNKIIAA